MKKSITLLFIAAAVVSLSLCGVFFYAKAPKSQPVKAEVSLGSEASCFSLSQARKYIYLCSLASDEEALCEKLQLMEYEKFRYISRNQEGTFGSGIAFSASVKREGDKTTVLLVFRGTHKGEWYSNFNIGEGTEHAGFSAATDFAQKEIEEYIAANKLSKQSLDVVITGHSRGGAVANLLAKRLVDSKEYKSVTAYTFATPNTTTAENAKASEYSTIYNIINPEDFIGYIPLNKWGYTRYGIDMEFLRNTDENYEENYTAMQKIFEELAGFPHTGYPFGASDVQIFLNTACKIAPTVSDYYNKELTVAPHRLTLYDYMQKVGALLSGDDTLANGMFLLSSSATPLFDTLTRFMMEGISLEDMAKSADITASAVNCAHTYETYMAWLEVLPEDYFL